MKKAGQDKETLKVVNIGLDDGYANVKLAWKDADGTIRTRSIPSRAKAGSLGVGSLFDDGPGAAMGYETEGERWTVAPGIEGESTRFPDYNLSSLARVLAHHALVSAGWEEWRRCARGAGSDRRYPSDPPAADRREKSPGDRRRWTERGRDFRRRKDET